MGPLQRYEAIDHRVNIVLFRCKSDSQTNFSFDLSLYSTQRSDMVILIHL
jgi:hypothetical protein